MKNLVRRPITVAKVVWWGLALFLMSIIIATLPDLYVLLQLMFLHILHGSPIDSEYYKYSVLSDI